jgi:hypothetical protein
MKMTDATFSHICHDLTDFDGEELDPAKMT